MHTPPTAPYTGLTIIMDQPSRFDADNKHLLSGVTAHWFEESCLIPPHTLQSIDARDLESHTKPLLPNTKFIALLGPKAAETYNASISLHGYPLVIRGCRATVAFFPQDCCDYRALRTDDDDDDERITDRDIKDKAPTRRKNWRFWTGWHMRKLLSCNTPTPPKIEPYVYPNLEKTIELLNQTEGQDLYLDIETSRLHRCLTVIGFSTTKSFPRVHVIPVYLPDGALAYPNFHRLHRALSRAFLRNTVVAHNGKGFDYFVLHAFYKFPIPPRPYDTLLANHRCFPEIEKSLSHLIAQWTEQPYHKDENLEAFNLQQAQRLWVYNAKDVYNLKLIKDAQLAYASKVPGLLASIDQANASIEPYLVTEREGLALDTFKLADTHRQLQALMGLYAKVAEILVGKAFNPGSPKQCVDFFHKTLNYPVVGRTKAGAPSLGSKQLYQLQLKHNNPLISVILKYRTAAKDAGSLESELWEIP